MVYAEGTTVTAERSRAEIERILRKWGVSAVALGWDQDVAAIMFTYRNRNVRINVPMPSDNSAEVRLTETGKVRSPAARAAALDRVGRERWRALVLTIKALLAAVDAGILRFEDAFLALTVLPDGGTVAEHVGPAIAEAYETGRVPSLLGPFRQALPA